MKKNAYIAELDAFRAIALLWVLLHHCLYGWPDQANALAAWPAPVTFVLSRGWLGVDLFFVLSGLLITGILLATKNNESYWRNFYARRGLRIMPLYYLVVLLLTLFYPGHGTFAMLSIFMLSNFATVLGVPVPHGGSVLWSLSVEQHFYLIWPLLVRWLQVRNLVVCGIAIVILSPLARMLAAYNGLPVDAHIYVVSWYRFDGLVLGALLAVWLQSKTVTTQKSLYLAGAFLAGSVLVTLVGLPFGIMQTRTLASTAFRGTQMQLAFGAAILAAAALQGSTWTAFLRNGFFKMTSNYSYCMYLVHLAVGDLFMSWFATGSLAEQNGNPHQFLLWRTAFMMAASYGIAALSFHFFEQPILGFKKYFEPSRPAKA